MNKQHYARPYMKYPVSVYTTVSPEESNTTVSHGELYQGTKTCDNKKNLVCVCVCVFETKTHLNYNSAFGEYTDFTDFNNNFSN